MIKNEYINIFIIDCGCNILWNNMVNYVHNYINIQLEFFFMRSIISNIWHSLNDFI